VADARGLAAILVGHTARDQAETVLMRILRGTGPAGLAGIPARRDRYVRPLLALERADVEAYVADRGLPVWDDPMNDDLELTRVRMRQAILPALRAENPQLDGALVRLAHSAAEWLEVIDAIALPLAALPVDVTRLQPHPAAIRKRAISIALEALGIDHEATHLDAIDRVVVAPARGEVALDLPGARLVRSYDRLALADTRTPIALRAPDGPYDLRTWEPGDRMRPARLKGRSRKLSDLYGDAKIPRAERATARVVVRISDGAIVWAEHLGLAFEAPESAVPNAIQMGGKF
ncbi:MAG TPA: tRNA lysidine(34) synthetase TilS, partial [Kofleriaceae bacterium]|nr:tRNA lysidine(34) synthetase TilS [Kofleriaceae bacterium]